MLCGANHEHSGCEPHNPHAGDDGGCLVANIVVWAILARGLGVAKSLSHPPLVLLVLVCALPPSWCSFIFFFAPCVIGYVGTSVNSRPLLQPSFVKIRRCRVCVMIIDKMSGTLS